MSSRNKFLSSAQRQAAPLLHQALMAGIAALQTGERDAEKIRQLVHAIHCQRAISPARLFQCG